MLNPLAFMKASMKFYQRDTDKMMVVSSGQTFLQLLPKSSGAHYAGALCQTRDASKPIFWYTPADAKNYRVIYGDLSVKEQATSPQVPVPLLST